MVSEGAGEVVLLLESDGRNVEPVEVTYSFQNGSETAEGSSIYSLIIDIYIPLSLPVYLHQLVWTISMVVVLEHYSSLLELPLLPLLSLSLMMSQQNQQSPLQSVSFQDKTLL